MLTRLQRSHPIDDLKPVVSAEDVIACQEAIREIHVDEKVKRYILEIVHASREHEDVLDYCTQNGIIFIPWFPLRDVNGDPSLQAKLKQIADKYNANPQQLVLAWLLKKSPVMLPIPGTLSIDHLRDKLAANQIQLRGEDFTKLTSLLF